MAQITLTQAEMCKAVEYYLNNHMFRMPHTVNSVKQDLTSQIKEGKRAEINDGFFIVLEQKEITTPAPKVSPIKATNKTTGPTMATKLDAVLKR